MDIRVLGPLEVSIDGAPLVLGGPTPRLIVALLVQAVGNRVSAETLLDAVYGQHAPSGGRRTVQSYLSKLRREFGEAIQSTHGGYVLDVDPEAIDAVRFETAFHTAMACLDDDPTSAARLLREALSWWRGHAYADVAAEGPMAVEVTRLDELRVAATEARIDADLALGRHREVLGELEALVARHPLRERLHAQRMLALYRGGRQADALQAYGTLRTRLVDELGLDPSEELHDLERRILDHDPGLQVDERRVTRLAVVLADLDPARWDDADAPARLRRRDEIVAQHIAREGAHVEAHGTAVLVTVRDVQDAIDLATALARGADGLRIAVDHGEVEQVAGAVTGPPVTRASRVLMLGHPGQVLLTAPAHAELTSSSRPGHTLTSLGTHEVTGLAEPVLLFQLEALGLPGPFPPLRSGQLPPPIPVPMSGSLPGYELRRGLATDGLGSWHLAYQPAVGREVEAFVVERAIVADPTFVQRFEVEAQRLARFTHPHVAGLLDFWRTPEQAALVFRRIAGRPVGDLAAGSGLPADQASTILGQIADALDHAHARGIVHGSLGPSSVVVDGGGSAWLRDLGIRQVCSSAPGAWLHDLAAPEVLDGAAATSATDVHGLGMLAHHLVTGAPPPPDGALPAIRPAIDEAVQRLTHADPALRPRTAGEAAGLLQTALGQRAFRRVHVGTRNPYRGLESFTELDAPDFHGRAALVEELVTALRGNRVVTAVGPSGIGKSSLVRAGLVPAVRAGAIDGGGPWVVTDCTPGDRPMERLTVALRQVAHRPVDGLEDRLTVGAGDGLSRCAMALLPPGARLLLVIDQFEELFTGTVAAAERARFLDLLCAVARGDGPVLVVLALRADVFDRPLEHARFGQVLREGLVPVRAPDARELAEIVGAPAASVGVEVEPALVARVVADTERQPGALPLVEHLLTELFDARDTATGVLRLDDYVAAGGVHGAIGRRAERVYDALDGAQRSIVRGLLLQLVAVDEHGAVGRRRAELPALTTGGSLAADATAVLERFGASRLLTFDNEPVTRVPTVELAHEALLREWDRLADWIEDARTDLVVRQRLGSAADAWTSSGDEADLLRGSRLLDAEERLHAQQSALGPDVRALVAASRSAADRERDAARARRRRFTTALASALAVALVLGGVAVTQWRSEAVTGATARARELAGLSTLALDDDPERSLLLALEAVDVALDRGPDALSEARSALQVATTRQRVVRRIDVDASAIAMSPDGRTIAASGTAFDLEAGYGVGPDSEPDVVALIDREGDGRTDLRLEAGVNGVAWVDDQRLLVALERVRVDDPAGVVVDVVTQRVVRRLSVDATGGVAAAEGGSGADDLDQPHTTPMVSADARHVAIHGRDHTDVWDVDSGELLLRTETGSWALPVTETRWLRWDGSALWELDVATGEDRPLLDIAVHPANRLAVRDGLLAVTVTQPDRRLVIVDLADGSVLATAPMASPSGAVAWLDDDRAVAGDNTGDAVVLRASTGRSLVERPLSGSAWDIATSPATTSMAVIGDVGGPIAVVDTSVAGPGAGFAVEPEAFLLRGHGEGDGLVAVQADGVSWVDTTSGAATRLLAVEPHPAFTARTEASPTGNAVAWNGDDDVATILRDGREIRLPRCHTVRAFDTTGRLALVDTRAIALDVDGCGAAPSHVLDVTTMERVVVFDTDPDGEASLPEVLTGEFGIDGTASEGLLVSNVDWAWLEVHDTSTAELVLRFRPEVEGFLGGAAISPDGATVAAGATAGPLTVIDLAGVREAGVLDAERHVRYVDVGDGGVLGLAVGAHTIAAGVGTRAVTLLDRDTLEELVRIDVSTAGRVAVALDDDALWYQDSGVVRRMPLDVVEAVAIARARLTRGWRAEECVEYGIEDCWTEPPSLGVP
jgi:DNA-binding SARP family transcriptional activator